MSNSSIKNKSLTPNWSLTLMIFTVFSLYCFSTYQDIKIKQLKLKQLKAFDACKAEG